MKKVWPEPKGLGHAGSEITLNGWISERYGVVLRKHGNRLLCTFRVVWPSGHEDSEIWRSILCNVWSVPKENRQDRANMFHDKAKISQSIYIQGSLDWNIPWNCWCVDVDLWKLNDSYKNYSGAIYEPRKNTEIVKGEMDFERKAPENDYLD